jgi:hypothetical protein
MPFHNLSEVVEFRFVNEKDPLGEKGIEPHTWNLEPDPSEQGKNRIMVPGTPGESVWRFARYRTQQDDDLIVRKTAKTQIKYNAKKARKEGRDYSPEFDQVSMMSGLMALITTMSRGWEGPEFIVPHDFTDANNQRTSHNGKLAQCTAYWIGQRDPVELRAVELFLQNLYEPDGEEDEESERQFPASTEGVDGPEGAGVIEADAGQSNGSVPVPAFAE